MRARHFGYIQGTWTTFDPIWPSEKAYIYALQRLTTLNDRSGLSSCSAAVDGSACLVSPFDCLCKPLLALLLVQASFTLPLPSSPPARLITAPLIISVAFVVTWIPVFTDQAACPAPQIMGTGISVTATSGLQPYQYETQNLVCTPFKSPIPAGSSYSILNKCEAPDPSLAAAMTLGNETFEFKILPDSVNCPGCGSRGGFRVHPDGPPPGTAGCIGLQSQGAAYTFRSCMANLRSLGVGSIPLKVTL